MVGLTYTQHKALEEKIELAKIHILDCEECIYYNLYDKDKSLCPCDNCYGFEYYKNNPTN